MLSTVSAIGGHVLKKPQQRKHDGQHYKAQFATSDYFSKESESSTSFTSKLEIQPNNNQSQLMTMARKAFDQKVIPIIDLDFRIDLDFTLS